MNKNHFKAHHMNATRHDLQGNDGIGRYVLLPGSDGRAKEIAKHFNQLEVKSHPRGHHLYLGTLPCHNAEIDVAVISSGMGCPSMEIILHELFHLGAKRFLRVGTAGSLQPDLVKMGQFVNVLASVRDEQTTADYVPPSVPAIASFEMTNAIFNSAHLLGLQEQVATGTVHCKSSFYAREWGAGPHAELNKAYVESLIDYGVLATEMETAALFIQSQLYNHQLIQNGKGPEARVLCGALLGILAIPPDQFASEQEEGAMVENLTRLALETIKMLWSCERIQKTAPIPEDVNQTV